MTEPPGAMKHVYTYAVSKGASDNDLSKIIQAQIVINCILQNNLQQCGIQKLLTQNPENNALLNSSSNRFLF